jgi:site-specific DNA recombinase
MGTMGKIVAAYARVSTERQAESQTIAQQRTALRAYAAGQGWTPTDEQVYRDDGWSGARLDRPALDRLRDAVSRALVDTLLIASPDRLVRRYAYQVWLLEEFARAGCEVVFLDRPPRDDPQDALLVQIRGAVAEYERAVIADWSEPLSPALAQFPCCRAAVPLLFLAGPLAVAGARERGRATACSTWQG